MVAEIKVARAYSQVLSISLVYSYDVIISPKVNLRFIHLGNYSGRCFLEIQFELITIISGMKSYHVDVRTVPVNCI